MQLWHLHIFRVKFLGVATEGTSENEVPMNILLQDLTKQKYHLLNKSMAYMISGSLCWLKTDFRVPFGCKLCCWKCTPYWALQMGSSGAEPRETGRVCSPVMERSPIG